jgi:hypothetical protein
MGKPLVNTFSKLFVNLPQTEFLPTSPKKSPPQGQRGTSIYKNIDNQSKAKTQIVANG